MAVTTVSRALANGRPQPLHKILRGKPSSDGSSGGFRKKMRGPQHPKQRSGAYRVFTRKRAILVKSSVTILRTGLHVAVNGDFAHNNLRSGRARCPVCQLYTIQTVLRRGVRP